MAGNPQDFCFVSIMHTLEFSPYRGSRKHKNRPADEQKGTLCPEWTHAIAGEGFANDVSVHTWKATEAAVLFASAECEEGSARRYATARGIAFEAKSSADGTWHGYPIPWEHVPVRLKNKWLTAGIVTKREVKRFWHFEKHEIHWALQTDKR